jgi:hypothetical protein
MRTITLIGMTALVFLGSFLGALWLIDSGSKQGSTDSRSDADRLSSYEIFGRSDLIEAGIAAGLHLSDHMKGAVDAITRADGSDVTVSGWLADPHGGATSLTVLVFVNGKKVASTETRGERPDVTEKIGLKSGAEKNVAFQAKLPCAKGSRPVVVGLGPEEQYFYFSSVGQCP